MALVEKQIRDLTPAEFKEAYHDMIAKNKDNLENRPLPTMEEVLNYALTEGEIKMDQFLEILRHDDSK